MCRLTQQDAPTELDDDLNPTMMNQETAAAAPNYKANHEPVGDPMEIPKEATHTRFHFQNPNGVTVGLGNSIEGVLEHAKNMGIDHLVLPETKLDTHQRRIKAKVHNHCRKVFGVGQYRATMAASYIAYQGDNKPGGLLGVTTGPATCRSHCGGRH